MPRFPVLLLVLLAALALPVSASAQAALGKVYRDIADDGALEPCDYSDAELASAEGSIPADVDQYSPELRAAIRDARAARARGECEADVAPRERSGREPTDTRPAGSAGPAATVEDSTVTEAASPPTTGSRASRPRSTSKRARVSKTAAPPAPPVGRAPAASGVASSAAELPVGDGAGAPAALVVLGLAAAALVLLYALLALVRRRVRP